jgi:hypothetical protein
VTKNKKVSNFKYRRFVDGLAVTLCYTVTTSPVRLMIFKLYNGLMVFMAQKSTIFTNPFHFTGFTIVKIGRL